MPFLTRKTGVAESNALMPGLRSDRAKWPGEKIVYRPSKSPGSLDGLPLPASSRQVQQRRLCGNEECTSGWTMPWRNRRRPIFEAQWGCSGRCVLAMVRAAVRRELGEGEHRRPLRIATSSTWLADAGAGMDYSSAAPEGAGGTARERDGANRRMARERMRPGDGTDRAWPEHAMGVSGADHGGILS